MMRLTERPKSPPNSRRRSWAVNSRCAARPNRARSRDSSANAFTTGWAPKFSEATFIRPPVCSWTAMLRRSAPLPMTR